MTKCNLLAMLLFFGWSGAIFSQTQIEFRSTTTPCPANTLTPCTTTVNQAYLSVTTQPAHLPPPPPSEILPRFKAFWITGDGNYWDFPDTETDAESLTPPIPYNYAKGGTYGVSVYLTGKYTDRDPPPGGFRQINVGNPPPTPPGGVTPHNTAPTEFRKRPGSGDYDFFPIHAIRKDYLIPFVVSYPASVDNSWGYLFYNGHANGTKWTERPLVFQRRKGIVADYYNGDSTKIKSYESSYLIGDAGVEGVFFTSEFGSMERKFSDFVFFPLETVGAASLPTGFDQKRYFPVFWADKNVAIGEHDSLASFCFIVTSSKPAPDDQQQRLDAIFRSLDWPLTAGNPINAPTNFSAQRFEGVTSQQQSGPSQYIQGVYMESVPYVAAHDPNQLTVQKIEAKGDNQYLVTFHLEMCNKGGGFTKGQTIDLFDRFGRFHDFQYEGAPVAETPANSKHFIMKSELEIPGIPDTGYAMMCLSIEFTAMTDCDGIRSLWAGNQQRAFKVCVKFDEAFDTECGENLPLDTCAFKIDEKCVCVEKVATCGGDGWLVAFVLLFVFVLLVWKYYNDKENGL